MPTTEYYAEVACCRPFAYGDSVFVLTRARAIIHGQNVNQDAELEAGFGLADNFCLREIVDGVCVWSEEIERNPDDPFLYDGRKVKAWDEGYTEEFLETYNSMTPLALNIGQQTWNSGPPAAAVVGKYAIFVPHLEGCIFCFSLEGDDKGFLWRRDLRNPRNLSKTVFHSLVGIGDGDEVIVSFRERLWQDADAGGIIYDEEWGNDDTFGLTAVRTIDSAAACGGQPAGLLWIDPVTGEDLSRWVADGDDVRNLADPGHELRYIYESFSWSSESSTKSLAVVPRPYGSTIIGYEPTAEYPGYKYFWSDGRAGHDKWGFASLRFEPSTGGIGEFRRITADQDHNNPYSYVNDQGNAYKYQVDPPGSLTLDYYYGSNTVTCTWRYTTVDEEGEEVAPARGSNPLHSLSSHCVTASGRVIFGPRSETPHGVGNMLFHWRSVDKNDGIIWETSLGLSVVGPTGGAASADGIRQHPQSTNPVAFNDKILAVICDGGQFEGEGSPSFGPARFVGISEATGAVLFDVIIDPALWGKTGGEYCKVWPEASISATGKFVVRIDDTIVLI